MVSASEKYNIVEKVGSTNKIFGIDIPFTDNSFWYRYVGTIRAGVDLSTAAYEQEDTTIRVELDQPKILSNTPDRDKSQVLEESNNILNPIHVEDVDSFMKQCQEESEKSVVDSGLYNEARKNAEDNIRGMFHAAYGDEYTIEFVWR